MKTNFYFSVYYFHHKCVNKKTYIHGTDCVIKILRNIILKRKESFYQLDFILFFKQ